MQHTVKIKPDLKWTALLMAGIFAHNSAFALGLGEIQLRSHLSEPLKAQIKVYGTADIKNDISCFNLSSENIRSLGNANLKLQPLNTDEAILTISSAQAIDEPIVNLSVAITCNSDMRRDYVVLLDPVLSGNPDVVADTEMAMPAVQDTKPAKTPRKAKAHRQTISKSSQTLTNTNNVNNGLDKNANIKASTGTVVASNTNSVAKTAAETTTSRPTLSISGGAYAGLPAPAALRMDKQLVMRPNAADPLPASDAEAMDELTAMNNRLKHLQTQITQLQGNNLKLAQDNAEKSKALAHNQEELTQFKWFGVGLGTLLVLLSGHIALDWWRRRKAHLSVMDRIMDKQEALLPAEEDDDLFTTAEIRQKIDNAAESSTPTEENFGIEVEPADPFALEDDNTMTVLEHADLFLSHGRTELAIQMLQNHLQQHPRQSVTTWLFLLDLLAKNNLQALYEQTALDCKNYFNINVPNIDAKPVANAHTLEAYPHLSAGLQAVWGTPAAITFLDDLIYNNRLEPRVGFDKQLIEELLALKSVAQERANLAEVIMLDEKKLALKERKEAQLAKQTDKLPPLEEISFASEETPATDSTKQENGGMKFDFGLMEWK